MKCETVFGLLLTLATVFGVMWYVATDQAVYAAIYGVLLGYNLYIDLHQLDRWLADPKAEVSE